MYICPMYSKELLKGTLVVIILKLLSEHKRMYGYEITQKVKQLSGNKIFIKEGSLYPALHNLKAERYVKTETINIGKRIRKYYMLTKKGEEFAKEKIAELNDFLSTINQILKTQKNGSIDQ